jgi:hypothetical protein
MSEPGGISDYFCWYAIVCDLVHDVKLDRLGLLKPVGTSGKVEIVNPFDSFEDVNLLNDNFREWV